MLRLQDGREVDISIDRARYHALRRNVCASDKQAELYQVVDVIYLCQDEYCYSSCTAADIIDSDDWFDDDKSRFYTWLRQPDQVRRIERARRRLPEVRSALTVKLNSSPQSLYSRLQQRLEALSLQSASVSQWRATLLNMTRSGIRYEELVWSGVLQHLANAGGDKVQLDKAEVLAAIDFSSLRLDLSAEQSWSGSGGLRFREVAQRMPHQSVYRAALKLDPSCHCVLRYVDEVCNYRVGVVKTLAYGHYMALNKYWFALDPYGRAIDDSEHGGRFYDSSEAAMQAANRHATRVWGLKGGMVFHTRYDHLTLYGGRDYREWLLSLTDFPGTFFGAHFFDHNVLLHIRTTVRSDSVGRRLLFIEELQSDWHQSGNKYGYDNHWWGKIANAPFRKEWPALAAKVMLIYAAQNGFDAIAWPCGEIQERRYAKRLDSIRRRYDVELPNALNRLGRPFGAGLSTTTIETRDPWLTVVRSKEKWRVADGRGKFGTRAKFSRAEAMEVLARHSKAIDLEVPLFVISDALRWEITEKGLPLFG
jgi:hypothetical protein